MSGPFARAPATMTPDKDLAANQRLRGRSLTLARIAWIVVAALTLSLFIVGIPSEFAQYHTACAPAECANRQLSQEDLRALQGFGLSLGTYGAYAVAVDIIFAAVYGAVAALIFWRRPDDRMALLVSIALLTFGIATFPDTMSVLAAQSFAWQVPVAFLRSLGAITFGIFLYIFPDGRFVPTWTRWVSLVWLVWQLPKHWFPEWIASNSTAWTIWLALAIWFVALGTIVYAQFHRYRHASNELQRQQIKWVVFGISTAIAGFLGTNVMLIAFVPDPVSARELLAHLGGHLVMVGGLLLIPLSIGVAILRYRLFDIDLIMNRALVYGALTTCVVLLYMLVVGGLGTLLQVQGSLIVSLIATGLAAVMFQPLRDRLQRGVNHLMYGERDDPYAVLSRLGQRLESTLAPDAVLPAVTRTLREALKLPYAEIQLRRKEGFETAAVAGDPAENALHLPLVYGGEKVGRLVVGPRAGDETFGPTERRLLENLAHQIGASVHAALMTDEALRLSADLQISRGRLVEAREEERRRLRRDLHDGLGPQLSSQALTVDAALALMRRDPDAAEKLLLELKADAQDAVTDIRRLVYGLRPPALDDLGLLGALRESAAQYSAKGLSVSVEAPESLPPLSAAVEVAAYRVAQEALSNVARHAEASTCTVSLGIDEAGVLCLEVRDDGRGLPDPQENASLRAGVGLTSMRERASELGGSLVVESLPERGTRVGARLPLPEEK
jgi:signal transduction histidine kinase